MTIERLLSDKPTQNTILLHIEEAESSKKSQIDFSTFFNLLEVEGQFVAHRYSRTLVNGKPDIIWVMGDWELKTFQKIDHNFKNHLNGEPWEVSYTKG
jgi:hypothetical protein